jgi:single-strand DNA-binding protein
MAAQLEIEGKLFKKFDTQQIKDTFRKREFVLETTEQYPQKIKLELTQEKCENLDRFQEGSMIKVSFNLRGSEWQGKYYVNLQAWRIENATGGDSNAQSNNQNNNQSNPNTNNYAQPTAPVQQNAIATNSGADDLPF